MGRGSYLGGGTLTGPRDDPHRVDNTAPLRRDDPDRGQPRGHSFYTPFETGRQEDWEILGFHDALEVLLKVQHAVLTGDVTGLSLEECGFSDLDMKNDALRMANAVMVNRRFVRERGIARLERTGERLAWNLEAIAALKAAVSATRDPDFGDEMPDLDPRFEDFLSNGR